MYKSILEKDLSKAINKLGFKISSDIVVYIPENEHFGEYSTNLPLQLSKLDTKKRYQNPREIANAVIESFGKPEYLDRSEVAGPGFINFYLKESALLKSISGENAPVKKASGENPKRIIVEYGDPNTHKMLHIGHLLPLTIGESVTRLLEFQGNEVFRANYGSDIGLTVAKCIYGIEKAPQDFEAIKDKSLREKAQFLGKVYALAHADYEAQEDAKKDIDALTKKLYQRDPSVIKLWEETKEWSLAYFDTLYTQLGTEFDRRINESEVDQIGKEIVTENVGKVFEEDQGAIIFPGEKYNLHNRVFITSAGNPTYEGKEVGLAQKYLELYPYDQLVILSHREQDAYFQVVIKANELLFPETKGKVKHLSFGELRLPTGKMSSRKGNVISAEEMIDTVKDALKERSGTKLNEFDLTKLAVAAIKFSILKYGIGSDIIYDIDQSISLHGDSGAYVMYVFARIKSLLAKQESGNRAMSGVANLKLDSRFRENDNEEDEASNKKIAQEGSGMHEARGTRQDGRDTKYEQRITNNDKSNLTELEPEERSLLRQLEYFDLTAERAAEKFEPNEVANYLLNLAKLFNVFYEKHSILGSSKLQFRLQLSKRVGETIQLGLYLLGIETVDRM